MFTRIDIRLASTATRNDALVLKNDIDQVLATGFGFIQNLKPYVVVEASPAKRPYLQAGGRFLGLLEKNGVTKPSVKAESGPPLRICDTRTSRLSLLAQFDVSKGWSTH